MLKRLRSRVINILIKVSKKHYFRPKIHIFYLVNGDFGQLWPITTRRAPKRLSTEKPNVSRVTSGYGGDMTPLSQVRLTPKNGGYIGVA